MKKQFFKKSWPNLIIVFLVVALTILIWHKVLFQVFLREGFAYFHYEFFKGSQEALLRGIFSYDTLARILFEIFPLVFKDNFFPYQFFMLLIMALVNTLFYLIVLELVGKKKTALLATILVIVNFAGAYEIFGIGDYTYFLQRMPHLVLALFSFWLLIRFVRQKGGYLTYTASLFFWLLAGIMGLFSLFIFPLFVFYPFLALKRSKIRLILPYVFIAFFLIWGDKKFGTPLVEANSFGDFILHNPNLISDLAYMFTWLTLPLGIFKWFREPSLLREPMVMLSIPLSFFYIGSTVYLIRKTPVLKSVVLTLILFIPSCLLLNAYTRPTMVYYIYESSRYLYIPFFALAAFWAILIEEFLEKKNLFLKIILCGLVGWWCFYNVNIIWAKIEQQKPEQNACRVTLDYIKKYSDQIPDKSLVLLPEFLGAHGAGFCQRFYGQRGIRFEAVYADWQQNLSSGFDLNKIIFLDYDFKNGMIIKSFPKI